MRSLSHKPTTASTASALGLFLLFQACGGSDGAFAQQAPDPLEGVWEGAVTIRDCTSSVAVAAFRGSQAFHQGGTMSDTNSNPTVTRGPGFGTWSRNGATYTIKSSDSPSAASTPARSSRW